MYTNDFYRERFNSAKSVLPSLIEDLDDTQFSTRPNASAWCVGEVVSHLINAGNLYLGVLEDKMNDGTDSLPKGSGPYEHPWHLRLFIKTVSPEFRRKVKTLRPFEPMKVEDLDRQKLLSEFDDLQDRFLKLVDIAATNQVDLAKVKVSNPVYAILKMNLSSCLAIMEAHQRRHFQQIEHTIALLDG